MLWDNTLASSLHWLLSLFADQLTVKICNVNVKKQFTRHTLDVWYWAGWVQSRDFKTWHCNCQMTSIIHRGDYRRQVSTEEADSSINSWNKIYLIIWHQLAKARCSLQLHEHTQNCNVDYSMHVIMHFIIPDYCNLSVMLVYWYSEFIAVIHCVQKKHTVLHFLAQSREKLINFNETFSQNRNTELRQISGNCLFVC